jgi:transposase-like protein
MSSPTLVNLSSLLDDAKCYALVRQHRWPEGVRCPRCAGARVARDGRDQAQPHRQRYRRAAGGARFDDLTGTVLAGPASTGRCGRGSCASTSWA